MSKITKFFYYYLFDTNKNKFFSISKDKKRIIYEKRKFTYWEAKANCDTACKIYNNDFIDTYLGLKYISVKSFLIVKA